MGQKKNKGLLIAIIVILVIIILLAGVMAYLYIFTDMFKSNKQLFFKYTSQIVQNENGFIDNQLIQYFEKKKSTSYENSGEITFEVSIPNMEDDLELANNFNITFSGKEDPSNVKSEKEIHVNYSDNVNFPLIYRKTNNITGIQTEYIGSNFVAVRNDEEVSGLEEVNHILQLQNLEFSNEEIQNLKTTYFNNILNQLDDNKFSTLTEGDLTGYRLTLTGEELKNVLVQILNVLKTDENTMHKLNEILGSVNSASQLDTDSIDELIDNINNTLEISNNIEITVYTAGGNLNRIDIRMASNTLTISKEKNEQAITYTISVNVAENDTSVDFTATYTGINSDNVNETYGIALEGKYEETNILNQTGETQDALSVSSERESIQLLITTVQSKKTEAGQDSTQISDTDIEEELSSGTNEIYTDMRLEKESDTNFQITFISTGDSFVINNTGEIVEEPEEVSTEAESTNSTQNGVSHYTYTITNQVQFTNGVEIEDLTEDNAVILNDRDDAYVTNLMSAIEQRLIEVNQAQMEELGVSESENPIQYLIPSFLLIGTNTAQINEQEVNTFNAKFELYESTNTKGATVKGLLTTIQNNNETDGNNKIEEINVDGEEYEVTEQNITYLKSSINVEDAYRVEFEKDSNTGLIYRAVINKR